MIITYPEPWTWVPRMLFYMAGDALVCMSLSKRRKQVINLAGSVLMSPDSADYVLSPDGSKLVTPQLESDKEGAVQNLG